MRRIGFAKENAGMMSLARGRIVGLLSRLCSARRAGSFVELKAEIDSLRSHLKSAEHERDELRALVENVSTLLAGRPSGHAPERTESLSNTNRLPPIRDLTREPTSSSQPQSVDGRGYVPPWLLVPRTTQPTCPMDIMLSELEKIGCRFESQNLRVPELEMDATPLFSSLGDHNTLVPTLKGDSIISSILVGHVSLALSIDRLPGRLAALWSMFYVVRWRICQSRETFLSMPNFFAPTAMQIRVPHPHWIDTLPWPAARDAIIQNLDDSQYPRFRKMLNETFIVHWDGNVSSCLRQVHGGDYTLSDMFHRHLLRLENWGLRKAAVAEFPFLRGVINIIEEGDR